MASGNRRRWTPQEKLRIIEEARKDGMAVSAVCRRHGIAPTQFYDWERRFKEGALDGLKCKPTKQKAGPNPAQLEAEIQRLKGIGLPPKE